MLPFEIENLVDEEAGPPGFLWMDECDPAAVDDRMPDHAGCRCSAGSCELGSCPCAADRLEARVSSVYHGTISMPALHLRAAVAVPPPALPPAVRSNMLWAP